MSGPRSSLSPEARALLDRERVIAPVPTSARTRMLARARAALAAGRVTPSAVFRVAPRRRWALALAVALACMASAAVGAAAYGMLAAGIPAASATPAALASLRIASIVGRPEAVRRSRAALAQVPKGETRSAPSAPASRVARSPQSDPGPEELRLLRQARAAVARRDFAAALPFIREHAQRFKNGHLTEEREALRVKALSGLGRTNQARRAANSFKVRFPRSVLSPAVTQMPAAQP